MTTHLSQFTLGLTSSQKCSATSQSGLGPFVCPHTAPWLPSCLDMSLCVDVISFPVCLPSRLGELLKGSGRRHVGSVPGSCVRAWQRVSAECWVLTRAEELRQTGKSCLFFLSSALLWDFQSPHFSQPLSASVSPTFANPGQSL